jgi:hypothetical protein
MIETSASYKDKRKYAETGVQVKSKDKRKSFGLDGGFSTEWDVSSGHINLSYTHQSKDKNTGLRIGGKYYRDNWELIYPFELRPSVVRLLNNIKQTLASSISVNQVINKKLQASISIEPIIQTGLLSTPFHRVYFTDTTHDIERLPNQRFKMPIALRANWYMTDWSVLRSYYRFYTDDFGIHAHTFKLEMPMKMGAFVVISPFYRFHSQTASWYFEPFAHHSLSSDYFTSDFDLSAFTAQALGIGLRYAPLFGFNNKFKVDGNHKIRFKKAEFRASKYFRHNDSGLILKAFSATLGLTFFIE